MSLPVSLHARLQNSVTNACCINGFGTEPQFICTPPKTTAASPVHVLRRCRPHCSGTLSAINGGGVTCGASSGGSNAASTKRLLQQADTPWYVGFQTNERTLEWEESAGIQMIKLYCCQKTGQDMDWVNARLKELVTLVPDIIAKLGRVKADLILALISDTQGIAQRLIELQEVLPDVDLSRLAARYPPLLLEHSAAGIRSQLQHLRDALPDFVRVEKLVEVEPVLLEVDVAGVLQEVRRLLPGEDPAKVLLRDPSMVLDMKQFRMGSSLQDTQ